MIVTTEAPALRLRRPPAVNGIGPNYVCVYIYIYIYVYTYMYICVYTYV